MADERQKATYQRILSLFDETEDMLDKIEDGEEPELEENDYDYIAESFLPFIKQINSSAEDLAATYVKFIEDSDSIRRKDIRKIRSALRGIVDSLGKTNKKLAKLNG